MKAIEILIVSPQIQSLMDALETTFTTHRLWEIPEPAVYFSTRGAKIRGLVTSFTVGADANLIASLPALEVIANYGVGTERIDRAAAKARGIVISYTPDINEPVADIAFGLLLDVTRRLSAADRYMRAGMWGKEPFPLAFDLGGKTCGIAGFGRIGRAIARRAEACGMKIAYYGPHPKMDVPYTYYDSLIALAAASDCLVLSLPGGEATRHCVNADVLNALGDKGYLINVARGSVLDENALIAALQNGTIAGAGLDVFEQEPLAESPLFSMDNVVILPHIASATVETRNEMGRVVMCNLEAHFKGQPLLTPLP